MQQGSLSSYGYIKTLCSCPPLASYWAAAVLSDQPCWKPQTLAPHLYSLTVTNNNRTKCTLFAQVDRFGNQSLYYRQLYVDFARFATSCLVDPYDRRRRPSPHQLEPGYISDTLFSSGDSILIVPYRPRGPSKSICAMIETAELLQLLATSLPAAYDVAVCELSPPPVLHHKPTFAASHPLPCFSLLHLHFYRRWLSGG